MLLRFSALIALLLVAFPDLIIILTSHLRSHYFTPLVLRDNIQQEVNHTFRVAIVGAGPGGSAAAFWISKANERSNLSTSVEIYEQENYIGGRELTFYITAPV